MSSDVHILVLTVSCDYTGGPPYPRVIRYKTYCSYVKFRIMLNAIYYVIFV